MALVDYSVLQCLSTKYNNFLRKFFGQKYSYFVSLPWKFDNPFSVFHISNTARSTVIIAMHNSHFNRGVVTRGPIGPQKFCLLWNTGISRPHVVLLWLAPQLHLHSDAPDGQCAHTWIIISGLHCAHVLLFE